MTAGEASSRAGEARRTQLEVSVSIRTILLIAGVVAVAWALASIASVLLVIFVSFFSVAVLSPVVSAMERRLRWSRRLSAAVLVLTIVIVLGAVVLVVTQAVVGAVRDFSDDLPRIVDEARQSDLGSFINSGSDSLDTLSQHAGEITSGVAKVSGGVADVGVSALGVVTLFFSVMFLTLFGLIDEPRLRGWVGGLLYRGDRERFLQVTDRIVQTTSRYMLGNLAISVVCGTVYGVTAVILDVPYPLALAVIAGILDLIPSIGATIAGIIVATRRALSQPCSVRRLPDRDGRLPADRELHPAADDHRKGGQDLRLHRARQRSCVRSALRAHRCDHRRADRGRHPDRRGGAHCRQESSHRRRGRRRVEASLRAGSRREVGLDLAREWYERRHHRGSNCDPAPRSTSATAVATGRALAVRALVLTVGAMEGRLPPDIDLARLLS